MASKQNLGDRREGGWHMDSVPRQVTRPEWAKATLAVEDRVCVGFQALAEVANGSQQAPLECSMQGRGMQGLCKGKALGGSSLWEDLQTFLRHLLHLRELSAPANDPPTASNSV